MITHSNEKSFWRIMPPDGVLENPMGYWCAPNAATPNYVACYEVEDFIAYGLLSCFYNHTPDNFALWHLMAKDDVQILRENFLTVLETICCGLWNGSISPGDQFDWGTYSQSISVGNLDKGDSDEVSITIAADMIEKECDEETDPAICVVFAYDDVKKGGKAGDDDTMWIRRSALMDKALVRLAIAMARKENNLGSENEAGMTSIYRQYKVPNLLKKYLQSVPAKLEQRSISKMRSWYKRNYEH